MSDAVAIISVAFSGTVGLAGLGSTTWSALKEREWRSREERLTELRSVLDSAGAALGSAMQSFASAVADLAEYYAGGAYQAPDRSTAIAEMQKALTAQREIGVLFNRIQVRLGPENPVAAAFAAAQEALGRVATEIESSMDEDRPPTEEFMSLYSKARDAETLFYEATAVHLAAKRG